MAAVGKGRSVEGLSYVNGASDDISAECRSFGAHRGGGRAAPRACGKNNGSGGGAVYRRSRDAALGKFPRKIRRRESGLRARSVNNRQCSGCRTAGLSTVPAAKVYS